MSFRLRFRVDGNHVHSTVFSSKSPNMTYANCGAIVVTKGEEFPRSSISFLGR